MLRDQAKVEVCQNNQASMGVFASPDPSSIFRKVVGHEGVNQSTMMAVMMKVVVVATTRMRD
jgi:hypothetical protein